MKPDVLHSALPPLSESLAYFDPNFRRQLLSATPSKAFSTIRTLEIAIKAGMTQQMLEVGYTEKAMQQLYRRSGEFLLEGRFDVQKQIEVGQRAFVGHTEAEWSVLFARDKLTLYDLGLISAKDGDLRKAKLLPPAEQALRLLQWKQFRERAETVAHEITSVVKKGGMYGKTFFRRLSDLVAKPPKDLDAVLLQLMENKRRQLQSFLLDNWAREWSVTDSVSPQDSGIPPLYTFKNKGLFDLLDKLANRATELKKRTRYQMVQEMDENGLGMVWRRLGLQRPDTGIWAHVDWERQRGCFQPGKRLLIWDRKPSSRS